MTSTRKRIRLVYEIFLVRIYELMIGCTTTDKSATESTISNPIKPEFGAKVYSSAHPSPPSLALECVHSQVYFPLLND